MDATRFRLGGMLEWVVAAAAIVAAVALGGFLAREARTVAAVMPVIAREAPAALIAAPAVIPAGAVSVPMLLLSDGRELRIGETLSAVAARLGRNADAEPPAVERAPFGERITRTYLQSGIRFWLVFEPFDEAAEPRLAAIYR